MGQLIHGMKRRMKELGWKAKDLSVATGMSRSGIYSILQGRAWPSSDNLDRIAAGLSTRPSHLFMPDDVYQLFSLNIPE